MVFSANSSNNHGNNEGWGMGFFLILFHHHHHHTNHNSINPFTKKKPSSYSLISKSNNNLIFSKTQYILSICGVLIFTTILLFTLSTFEPTSVLHHNVHHPPRRSLKQTKISKNTHERFTLSALFSSNSKGSESNFTPALQGMGTLFLRGSKAMTDLIVGHVNEDTSEIELRSFLRLIYFSGIFSRSDIVFIFGSPLLKSRFSFVVKNECDSFLRLVQLGRFTEFGSGLNRYLREVGEGEKEPVWGRKKGNSSELTRSSYGSVVGFDASELDPEDSLSGFLDHVPMNLRRWACYPMLLGRVRRQFKHTMLVDVQNIIILSDPFTRVWNRSSESLFLWSNPDGETTIQHHGKRNSGKTHELDPETRFYSGIIVGGSRGVRKFAASALTEIVKNVIERNGKRKSRNSVIVTESGLVKQLVHNGHLLKSINLITPTESIFELSSLHGFNSNDSSLSLLRLSDDKNVVKFSNGLSVDINKAIMREICASHRLYSSVYNDCFKSK